MNRYRTNKLMVISLFCLLIVGIDSINAQSQLAIPDTLSGSNISLTIQNGVKTFYPGYLTQTIGINGNILGPTLILHKGETVRMLVRNSLLDTTTIHWHGLHVPAETDGGPHTVILPVSFWQPQFSIKDKAAMYWYHPHAHGKTAEQVTKGAAGLIIVRDEEESLLLLPRTYGVDDLPIVVQSRAFDLNKQFIVKSELDSVILVNGDMNAFVNVPAQIVRLRLLNGSTERTYNFGFNNNKQFYQIAGDGGLLDKPVIRTRLRLAPGERAEILVDFGTMQGQTTSLMSYASELPAGIIGASLPGSMGGTLPGYSSNKLNGSDFVILKLEIVNPTPNAITQMPSTLTLNIPWNISQVNATRTFTFTSAGGMMNITGPFLINGASFNMNFINFTTKLNNVEIWTLRNNTGIAHPFHLHGVQFYLLDRNGIAVAAGEKGRKDNVLVLPNETVRFITKFEDYSNGTIPFVYHCHLLSHEDEGMMGQYTVTDITAIDDRNSSTDGFSLDQNYPNPFNPNTSIMYTIPEKSKIQFSLYNIQGELVREIFVGENEPGYYKMSLAMSEYTSGVYFIRFMASNDKSQFSKVLKIVLIK